MHPLLLPSSTGHRVPGPAPPRLPLRRVRGRGIGGAAARPAQGTRVPVHPYPYPYPYPYPSISAAAVFPLLARACERLTCAWSRPPTAPVRARRRYDVTAVVTSPPPGLTGARLPATDSHPRHRAARTARPSRRPHRRPHRTAHTSHTRTARTARTARPPARPHAAAGARGHRTADDRDQGELCRGGDVERHGRDARLPKQHLPVRPSARHRRRDRRPQGCARGQRAGAGHWGGGGGHAGRGKQQGRGRRVRAQALAGGHGHVVVHAKYSLEGGYGRLGSGSTSGL
jgi:hypothetical protein